MWDAITILGRMSFSSRILMSIIGLHHKWTGYSEGLCQRIEELSANDTLSKSDEN